MQIVRNRLIALMLLCAAITVAAQPRQHEFKIAFTPESSALDPDFGKNREQLDAIDALLGDPAFNDDLIGITFAGASSPEGSKEFNDRLTVERRQAIERYFAERSQIPVKIVSYDDINIDWPSLRQSVDRSEILYKDEIIDIIDEGEQIVPYYGDRTIDRRVLKLRKIHGGSVWRYILDEYFPEMRYSKAVVVMQEQPEPLTPTADEEEPPGPEPEPEVTEPLEEPLVEEPQCVDQRWALKTNFLYDAILMPSLQLEYKINRHWSVDIQGDVAWWKNDRKHKYYQIATITPEVRYKFNGDTNWRGHYIGLFGGFSWYDLENGARGYKGEAGFGGISYYYAWPIGKHLSLEAGIGVGVLHTRYKEYLPIDGHYVYQRTSKSFYVGPLKLEFSLVWRFANYKCK